jgi:hypothetical protein
VVAAARPINLAAELIIAGLNRTAGCLLDSNRTCACVPNKLSGNRGVRVRGVGVAARIPRESTPDVAADTIVSRAKQIAPDSLGSAHISASCDSLIYSRLSVHASDLSHTRFCRIYLCVHPRN